MWPRQSSFRRRRTMLRPFLLAILLTQIRSAHVTDPPTFADRLDRLYEKVEKFTIGPAKKSNSKLYAKLDRLNSLTPDRHRDLSDDDDELLSAMKLWGSMSDEQLRGLVREIQQMKDEDRSERLTDADYDADWPDDEQDRDNEDYNNDGEEWDPLEDETGSTSHPIVGVTPSAFTRLDARDSIDYIDPIAATNERPRILDDSHATPKERMSLRKTAFANVREVFRSNGCLVPQPRWLYLRNLAPAADTLYVPPCVKLHRCAPDACCCRDERQECAPIDGKYVAIPVYLGKANHNLTVARMLFFNHTRCSCIYRESMESTARAKIDFREERRDELLARRDNGIRERQNDWRAPTEEPKLERDEEQTSPPQLRRCTCPALFRNRVKDGICSCVCDWPDTTRKRDCLSLARGKEHFGLRDRVCVAQGDCAMPSCEHGPYERSEGRCPYKRFKRRYHSRRYQDKV